MNINRICILIINLYYKLKTIAMCYSNHRAESIRMYLRLYYCVFIWEEYLYTKFQAALPEPTEREWWWQKIPVWGCAFLLILLSIIEKRCYKGTRVLVLIFEPFFWIHLGCFSASQNQYFTIVSNIFLDLGFFLTYYYWASYGDSDMSSFVTHGPFRPGLKRFTSQHGNDCMAFYPVNKSVAPVEV